MQRDGDLYDLGNMSDDEIRSVVLEHLRESGSVPAGAIDVVVRNGSVTLAGRVGTDAEAQAALALVDDVLGIDDFSNELVVDPLYRSEMPTAADDAGSFTAEMSEAGGPADLQQSDTSDHLVEDLDAEMFGTRDASQATRDGTPYLPQERPASDGYGSREKH